MDRTTITEGPSLLTRNSTRITVSLALALILQLLAVAPAQSAGRDIRYVDTASALVRLQPEGTVSETVSRGTVVIVNRIDRGWANIDTDRHSGHWISASLLCSGAGCWNRSAPSVGNAHALPAAAGARLAPARAAPRASSSSAYSCPCSARYNCTGPRGGQYCITSGGNKRYR